VPFKSWDCITLQLKYRDIDLIIENETAMKMFLKLLCYKMNSIDGTKDSAGKIKELMFNRIRKKLNKNESKVADESIY
jgi:hypothetical protein